MLVKVFHVHLTDMTVFGKGTRVSFGTVTALVLWISPGKTVVTFDSLDNIR